MKIITNHVRYIFYFEATIPKSRVLADDGQFEIAGHISETGVISCSNLHVQRQATLFQVEERLLLCKKRLLCPTSGRTEAEPFLSIQRVAPGPVRAGNF